MLDTERAHQELRESEERLKAFMHHSPVLAFMKDDEGRYVYINPEMERTFHVSLADVEGKADHDWLPEHLARTVQENDRLVLSTGRTIQTVETIAMPDGAAAHWMVLKFPFTKPDGRRFVGGVAVDVTRLKRTEELLAASERRYRHLVESGHGLICTHDMAGVILSVNPAALKLLEYSADELVGASMRDLLPVQTRDRFDGYLERIAKYSSDTGLMLVTSKSGRERTWQYHNVLIDEAGHIPYVLGHAQDVTELRQAQEELRALSVTDELTGLQNRRGFFARATEMLKASSRTKQEFSVVYVDVDGLKAVNDSLGHDAGSALIVGAGDVLKHTFRAADVIGRLGGDEFVVLAATPREAESLIRVRMQRHLDNLNARAELPARLSLSVGMSHFTPGSDTTLEELVKQADMAMYEQKQKKRGERTPGERQ